MLNVAWVLPVSFRVALVHCIVLDPRAGGRTVRRPRLKGNNVISAGVLLVKLMPDGRRVKFRNTK